MARFSPIAASRIGSKKGRSDHGRGNPKLAVWKFTSCDGCQLSLLDLEDELLAIADRLTIAYFMEATRAVVKGPYDLSLVEGSVSTPEQLVQVKQVRKASRVLVTIGTCATSGGIQALRNFADVTDYLRLAYPEPRHLKTLTESTPISNHVPVDLELQGCPINKHQLLEVVSAYLHGGRLQVPGYSVCLECKRRGNICVLVSRGLPRLGPVTRRVRRPVSCLSPGLLRLLRPQGNPEHPVAGRLVWGSPESSRG